MSECGSSIDYLGLATFFLAILLYPKSCSLFITYLTCHLLLFILLLFLVFLSFFVSLTWNSLFLIVALITFLWTWTNHNLKCLCLFFPLIGVTPIFMSHFKSYPSLHFPRVYFNILISATFILYVYCFLTA